MTCDLLLSDPGRKTVGLEFSAATRQFPLSDQADLTRLPHLLFFFFTLLRAQAAGGPALERDVERDSQKERGDLRGEPQRYRVYHRAASNVLRAHSGAVGQARGWRSETFGLTLKNASANSSLQSRY